MILAYDTPGQLGNQLWAYSNLIAVAKEYNVSVIIIFQQNYYKLLDAAALQIAKRNGVYVLDAGSYQGRIIRKLSDVFFKNNNGFLAKGLPVTIVEDGSVALQKIIEKSRQRLYIVNAWEQRIHTSSFLKENDFIRSVILPEADSRKKAAERIELLRQKFDVIVAVHIRRGDYKTFLDGTYYFEDDVYLHKMEQINHLLTPAKVVFAIFSNEKIDIKNFSTINTSFSNDNTPIGDMWGISLCDYILGPLSTFSMWASFWHNVPLLFIEKNTVIHSMEMFRPVIAQDVQKSGAVIS